MAVSTTGDKVIRQTKMRFNYLPGKSHLIFMTFVLGTNAGTIKRVGYFNSTFVSPFDAGFDGIYLEREGTETRICLARGGTVMTMAQDDWNYDTFDGTGPSGLTLDWNAPQIFFIDMEWLGVGRVRTGFVVDGAYQIAHEFRNANNRAGQAILEPYIQTPNHSLRYEIRSTGGAGTLLEICGSVQSEGGYDLVGNLYAGGRGITALTTTNTTNIFPLISLRLRQDRPGGSIIIQNGSLLCTTTADAVWRLILNPTVAGVDAASWQDVGGNSSAQIDVARTTANTLSGGTVVASGYLRATTQSTSELLLELNSAIRPGIGIGGAQDELVLAIQNLANGQESYFAELGWREPL
jgi:hypothetical protein